MGEQQIRAALAAFEGLLRGDGRSTLLLAVLERDELWAVKRAAEELTSAAESVFHDLPEE